MKIISPEFSDPVRFRLHVLDHCYKHGIKSSVDALGLPRTTIYTWEKKFEEGGKKSSSFTPASTRPHNTRQMTLSSKLVEFIKAMRLEYDHVGKGKIKYFQDKYARQA